MSYALMLIVNLAGIALIVLTLWWFFVSRDRVEKIGDRVITIRVKDGVYEPARIKIAARSAVILRFIREDPAPCADAVIFPSLNRNYNLSMGKPLDVSLTPQLAGAIEFTCHSGMYKGSLIIE